MKDRSGSNNPNWKGDARKSQKEIRRTFYLKHKDDPDFKEKVIQHRLENAGYYKKKREANSLWKQSNPASNLWSNAKYRAKRKGFDFDLEVSDIIIPERCPYLGIILTSEKLKGHRDSHMSLDRIDNTKGYIKNNVEVISYKANAMKQNATHEQLVTFAQNILKRASA